MPDTKYKEAKMLQMSRRREAEGEMIENLLSAHKRIAGSGNVMELIKLTRYILRLLDQRKDVVTYLFPEDEQDRG